MLKLTSEQISRKNEIYENLKELHSNLESAISDYNEAITEAASFFEEISGEMENYFDEKSSAWQDGDKGVEYQNWLSSYQDLDLPECDNPSDDFLDIINDLPVKLGGN